MFRIRSRIEATQTDPGPNFRLQRLQAIFLSLLIDGQVPRYPEKPGPNVLYRLPIGQTALYLLRRK